MPHISAHTFHIPVMGLAYTIDTPVKVARFGISSVVSIIQDVLLEQMRAFYCQSRGETFMPIPEADIDHRAKRVTAYLNLLQQIVEEQVATMKQEPFEPGKDIVKYFELLPEGSPLKDLYLQMTMLDGASRIALQEELRDKIVPGAIDVNVMTKIDNLNYDKAGEVLPVDYSDAAAAFRGFANSNLQSSIVFSAGMNPRLFAYLENFPEFFPDAAGKIRKKIILKVSDYRSAIIQGKYLAKKGVWVSEFRVESGLNCGGHAFPTDGVLLGPILEEFKMKKAELTKDLMDLCNQSLRSKDRQTLPEGTAIRITVQGGIGTPVEDRFLKEYYNIDGTGWGSPFLMVPEATNVDNKTLNDLVHASPDDYYLSHASPFGVPFNNFRKSTSHDLLKLRINKNRPGSPCYKKLLASNTEFTEKPICTASREYQHLKIKALQADPGLDVHQVAAAIEAVTEKDCLCEGLAATALHVNNIPEPHRLDAVTIAPVPTSPISQAYFPWKKWWGISMAG